MSDDDIQCSDADYERYCTLMRSCGRVPFSRAVAGIAARSIQSHTAVTVTAESDHTMELSAQQKQICRALGISEQAFSAALETPPDPGLTAAELTIAERLGVTPEAYAAAKTKGLGE